MIRSSFIDKPVETLGSLSQKVRSLLAVGRASSALKRQNLHQATTAGITRTNHIKYDFVEIKRVICRGNDSEVPVCGEKCGSSPRSDRKVTQNNIEP